MRSTPSIASMSRKSSANPVRPRRVPAAVAPPDGQVAAIGVDVLPEQRHLAHAVGDHRPHLLDELAGWAADLASPRGGDYAVGADAVAPHADLQPPLEWPRAACGEVPGEALELEVALGRERVARQELRELVHLAGAERDIDEREALEHLLLERLRPAAADADDPLGLLALQPLGLPEMRDEAAVGRLANRARVEQDEVRVAALGRLRVAERIEHALHPLGVVLVHLA